MKAQNIGLIMANNNDINIRCTQRLQCFKYRTNKTKINPFGLGEADFSRL